MAVYIEYVLLDNIIIDYLLLKYTFKLVRGKSGFWRLFFCAVLGAAFAAILPLVALPGWAAIPIKIAFSAALVWAAGNYATKKSYIFSFIVFNLYTFLLGGSVTGIFNIFGLPLDREYSVGLVIAAAYGLIRLTHKGVEAVYRRRNIYAYVSECEITLNGQTIKAKGFLDTGNRLYDRETDTPVNPNSIMSEERREEAEARRTGIRGTRSASNGRNPVFSGMSTGRRPIGFPLRIICATIRLRKNPRSI